MSDTPPREWRFYIDDMIACAQKVAAYTHGLDQVAFVASGLNYDATRAQPGADWRGSNPRAGGRAPSKPADSVATGHRYP